MYFQCLSRYLSRCYISLVECVFLVDSALYTFQSTERCWCINCGSEVSGVESDEIPVIALEEMHKKRNSYLDEMKKIILLSLYFLPLATQKVQNIIIKDQQYTESIIIISYF